MSRCCSPGFNGQVPSISTRIVLVDPLGPIPPSSPGRANSFGASTTMTEDKALVIRAGPNRSGSTRALRRVADIHLTEHHRRFMHVAFPAMARDHTLNTGVPH